MNDKQPLDFIVVIPARLGASRLPDKPLLQIGDKPLIQHVYEQAKTSQASRVVIATDSQDIEHCAKAFNAELVITASTHASGTDRIAEACQLLELANETVVVNVQADEFNLPASLIEQAARNLLAHEHAAIATLCEPVLSASEKADPNVVKVVFDEAGMALYFSRAAIPHGLEFSATWRHIGLYAYTAEFVQTFCQLPPSQLERQEKLEQLRAMSHGYPIHVDIAVEECGIGIDTAADLKSAQRLYEKQKDQAHLLR